ncbi:MAG: hypothetical protein R3Y06_03485 [Faecalibacterium sp.]
MAAEQAGFKTSVLGFRKADVLACIDRISAENLEMQEKAEKRAKELEEMLATVRTEKDGVCVQLAEKEAELLVLQDALTQQDAVVKVHEESLAELTKELKAAQTSAHDYKARLFEREGEATLLRRDNTQLTEVLAEKQKEMDRVTLEANEVQRVAAHQVELVRAEAAAKIDAEAKRLQMDHQRVQAQMKGSATDIAHEVVQLKAALSVLDEKIATSLSDMQRSTNALAKALEGTERNVASFGVKLARFPETEAAPKAEPQDQFQNRKTGSAPSFDVKPASISSFLISKIGKMLGDL